MFDPEKYLQVVLKMPGAEQSRVAMDCLCAINFVNGQYHRKYSLTVFLEVVNRNKHILNFPLCAAPTKIMSYF